MRRNSPSRFEPFPDMVAEDSAVYEARTSGKRVAAQHHYRLIDLFSGAGGMTLGFSSRFGNLFRSVWANDFESSCVATYNANFGEHCCGGDIVSILQDPATYIPPADVVIGGPPCQGFSLLNKNREGDSRKQLWRPFLEVVKRSKAAVFVMENVPQLLGSYEHGEIMGTAEEIGFKVWGEVLCAADFGVPQTRKRAIIVACKYQDPRNFFPPRKSHFDPSKSNRQTVCFDGDRNGYLPGARPWVTVRHAIGDLAPPVGTEIRKEEPPLDLQFGRSPTELSMQRYRTIPEEGMNRFDLYRRAPQLTPQCWIRKTKGGTDLFGRLWWDRPAFTIRTEFFKPEKGRYLHPHQHRPITHREAARLQSFPDDFQFLGSKIEIARQIGNAVPPLLAARVSDIVLVLLKRTEHKVA